MFEVAVIVTEEDAGYFVPLHYTKFRHDGFF